LITITTKYVNFIIFISLAAARKKARGYGIAGKRNLFPAICSLFIFKKIFMVGKRAVSTKQVKVALILIKKDIVVVPLLFIKPYQQLAILKYFKSSAAMLCSESGGCTS
jgi:hypothetical protein